MKFIKKHPYLFWQCIGFFILAVDCLYVWFNLENEQVSYAFIVLSAMLAFGIITLSPFVIKCRKKMKDPAEIEESYRYKYIEEWYIHIYGSASELKKYKNPKAKQIDEECNRKSAKWLGEYEIYLTDSFLVSMYGGITAIDIDKISSVILYNTEQGAVIMDARKTDESTIKIYEETSKDVYIYEEEKDYFEMAFGSRNIDFICKMEVLNDELEDEEDF